MKMKKLFFYSLTIFLVFYGCKTDQINLENDEDISERNDFHIIIDCEDTDVPDEDNETEDYDEPDTETEDYDEPDEDNDEDNDEYNDEDNDEDKGCELDHNMEIIASTPYYFIYRNENSVSIYSSNCQRILSEMRLDVEHGTVVSVSGIAPDNSKCITTKDPLLSELKVNDTITYLTEAINKNLVHKGTISEIDHDTGLLCFEENLSLSGLNLAAYGGGAIYRKENLITTITIEETGITSDGNSLSVPLKYDNENMETNITLTINENSPKIDFKVKTLYKNNNIKVFRESIIFEFNSEPEYIFHKNKKRKTKPFTHSGYWINKEGVQFGSGENAAFSYHNPLISSMLVKVEENELKINLDNMSDHRYRQAPDTEHPFIRERHASEHNIGDIRKNSFSIYFGVEPLSVPRLMHNPDGYLAAYIWTEHADFATLDTHRAVNFGRSDITSGNKAVAGFVKHNIPVTKSVYYYQDDTNVGIMINNEETLSINHEFLDFLNQLHIRGFDIGLHTPGHFKDSVENILEANLFMNEHFNSKTWIDHAPTARGDGFSGKNLFNEVADQWKELGVKYFWHAASEDRIKTKLDLMLGESSPLLRTPLYWKHPTVTGNYFISFATVRHWGHPNGSLWDTLHSDENLEEMIKNRGVYINHTYPSYIKAKSFFEDEGVLYIDPEFDAVLERLRKYMDKGYLNVTTIAEIVSYWEKLENIEINYSFSENGTEIFITNNNHEKINGFSFALDKEPAKISKKHSMKFFDGDYIITLDIEPEEAVSIELKP